jgi:hydrogenase small subunit
MSPFYRRLSNPPGFAVDVTADKIGLGLVAVVTGLSVAHGTLSYARARREDRSEAQGELLAVAAGPSGAATGEPEASPAEPPVTIPPDEPESQEGH